VTNIDGLYNKDVAKSYFDRKHFVDGKLTFEIFERATILPHANELPNKRKPTCGGFGGLVDNKGNRVTMSPNTTIYEQLNLLINTESFASTLGSCSHNSVFLRDGTETILIPRSSNAFTGFQTAINQVSQLNAKYVDSTLSVFNEGHDLFCFIISKQLKEFFGDKFTGYTDDDFKIFLTYVTYAASVGRNINEEEVAGYGATFSDFMIQLSQRKDLLQAYGINLT